MINKRVVAIPVLVGTMAFTLTGCWGDGAPAAKTTAQQAEQGQASSAAGSLIASQPVHKYSYSQIRQNLQELLDAQANGVVTTSFFFGQDVGAGPVFSCPSVGAPIASTTELTNPSQLESHWAGSTGAVAGVIGQMDPTGVYPGNSTGTYAMCVGADGSVNPFYWEGFVGTAFGPAHWDRVAHQVVIDGPSGSKFTGMKK